MLPAIGMRVVKKVGKDAEQSHDKENIYYEQQKVFAKPCKDRLPIRPELLDAQCISAVKISFAKPIADEEGDNYEQDT